MKKILSLTIAAGLTLCVPQFAQARGFGGTHPEGGSSEHHTTSGSPSGGNESEEHRSTGTQGANKPEEGAILETAGRRHNRRPWK